MGAPAPNHDKSMTALSSRGASKLARRLCADGQHDDAPSHSFPSHSFLYIPLTTRHIPLIGMVASKVKPHLATSRTLLGCCGPLDGGRDTPTNVLSSLEYTPSLALMLTWFQTYAVIMNTFKAANHEPALRLRRGTLQLAAWREHSFWLPAQQDDAHSGNSNRCV